MIDTYISNTMVCPSRFSTPPLTNMEFEHRNCHGSARAQLSWIPVMEIGGDERSICGRGIVHAKSPLVHVLDFSRPGSIIIHPPSPPSARLNYPGLERGTKDGSRESRLLFPVEEEKASGGGETDWRKGRSVTPGSPLNAYLELMILYFFFLNHSGNKDRVKASLHFHFFFVLYILAIE